MVCTTASDALLTLVEGDVGLNWANQREGWDQTTNVCQWFGVTCDSTGHVVEGVDLAGSNFEGMLTTELGCLTGLKNFNMNKNSLYGSFPQALADIASLNKLDISENQVTGSVPIFGSKDLLEVVLGSNSFTGKIPDTGFASLHHPNLVWLDLSFNKLSGSIPPAIASMEDLEILELSNNNLTGSIPATFGNLTKLEDLFLDANSLTGTLPLSLFTSTSKLKKLWLHENLFSGTLPQQVSNLQDLLDIYIDGCKLQGTIPPALCDMNVNIDHDHLVGDNCDKIACPVDSRSMPGQEHHGLGSCEECPDKTRAPFLGSSTCGTTRQRQILIDFYNHNNGDEWAGIEDNWNNLSTSECKWTGISCNGNGYVEKIELHSMNLSGSIYEGLGYLEHLTVLNLSDNALTGLLPVELSLPPLTSLDISGNRIGGAVPSVICQKSDVNGNGLDGTFSCAYVACPGGTYSSTGHATMSSACKSCTDEDSIFLGSKLCDSPGGDSSSKDLTDGFIIGLSAALAFVAFGFVGWFILRRKGHRSGKDNATDAGSATGSIVYGDARKDQADDENTALFDCTVSAAASRQSTSSAAKSSKKEVWLDVPRI